ncbi:molybdate-anion transporter isoform X2 [Hyalella azteca]|uniref:Molybdate-anion transporter n=1 Tax=Hyalella azteca TaxID=294128 RepID=A0A8B7NVW5_HYAAZ|nr:molybdate-anion transporter isoform X2 [Hyalella azteca]
MSITMLVYPVFCVLVLGALILQFTASKTQQQIASGNNPHFKKFQYSFFLVYFMALFSDWLQGPYVYKLYSHYGYASNQIALLYVVGFASSVVFGTTTGPIADRFGRKKMALAFCLIYSFCCLTKLSSSFFWLFLGRVFGGISTSMLFSTFESWYVYEHTETHDFPSEWISVTLSKATFWNGLLAINAGIFANVVAETLHFGPVAPFMFAIPFLLLSGIIIAKTWPENYGNTANNLRHSCMEGLRTIIFKEEILYLGIVQSLFEANMYIFVFQWTPILDEHNDTPLGMVFASFMVCIMVGSSLYAILLHKKVSEAKLLTLAVIMAMVSMAICVLTSGNSSLKSITYAAFLLLEVSVGMYFPSIGYLRSQVIPEELRAGIMNWFRVPMNILTCSGLLLLHNQTMISNTESMFAICTIMLAVALVSSMRFSKLFSVVSVAADVLAHSDEKRPLNIDTGKTA